MVDIGDKPTTDRIAVAEAKVFMTAETLRMIKDGEHKKGDVLGVARIAGIMRKRKIQSGGSRGGAGRGTARRSAESESSFVLARPPTVTLLGTRLPPELEAYWLRVVSHADCTATLQLSYR